MEWWSDGVVEWFVELILSLREGKEWGMNMRDRE